MFTFGNCLGKESSTKLKILIGTDSLWYKNVVSLGSPEMEERSSPRLSRKL